MMTFMRRPHREVSRVLVLRELRFGRDLLGSPSRAPICVGWARASGRMARAKNPGDLGGPAPVVSCPAAYPPSWRLDTRAPSELSCLGKLLVDELIGRVGPDERRQAQVDEVREQSVGLGFRARAGLHVDDLEDRGDDRLERQP